MVILVILLIIILIGCLVRNIIHNNDESKFDVSVEKLISTEICGDHYIVYFDASAFPSVSDDASNTYFTYRPELTIKKSGRVDKGDLIACVSIKKQSSNATPSSRYSSIETTIQKYDINSPYTGIVCLPDNQYALNMRKFVICKIKTVDANDETENENNDFHDKYGISEQYYNDLISTSNDIVAFEKALCQNPYVIDAVSRAYDWPDDNSSEHIQHLIIADCINYFEESCTAIDLNSKEGFGLIVLVYNLLNDSNITVTYNELEYLYKIAPTILDYIHQLSIFSKETLNKPDYVFPVILSGCEAHLRAKYCDILHKWAVVIAKADSVITSKEELCLNRLSKLSSEQIVTTHSKYSEQVKCTNNEKIRAINPLTELESMIGLNSVKDSIRTLYNFVRVQKLREDSGLKSSSISYHCVFTGNPGTGKTTVARIVANIYRDLGILKKGHLIETDRSGLVAEYVGQTAIKTNKIIDSALDGVLFIDEAYTLSEGGQGDYGKEAIATLLKRMEDDRDRLVVILAGYSSKMNEFINANPGLQSRFNRYIEFPDYTASELNDIFHAQVRKNDYILDVKAEKKLQKVLNASIESHDPYLGNGRFTRNLFEITIQNQANRLSLEKHISPQILRTIISEDIPG